MKTLRLSTHLALPLDAVTEKLAWLGRTGSGKTYGAMKLAELMLEAGAQIGAIDPVGVWRALRVPAERDGQSFEVVVFGGLYGDLPLEPTELAGHLVADLVTERGLSFVLDVSQFIPAEQQRFVRGFADRFFHRKKSAPSAVHLFMEECQEYIPENPSGDEAKTLGVMQRLWKLGRNFGIGGSLISQRPQEIAKKALNMSGTLFAFQMTGPQERKAVRAWVADQGIAVDIEGVLQKLAVGEPHVESPTFLEVSRTVRILPRVTADLSSTPKVGSSTMARRPLTPIDVEQLTSAMAATIEQAKANDPALLKKRIAELERELKAKPSAEPQRVEIPVVSDEQLLRAHDLAAVLVETGNRLLDEGAALRRDLARATTQPAIRNVTQRPEHVSGRVVLAQHRGVPRPDVQKRTAPSTDGALKGGKFRAMLVAMAQAGRPLTDRQVAARAVMSLSGTFDKYLGQQRTNGWVEGTRQALSITAAGLAALGDFEPLPTGADLQQHWLGELGAGKKREMLQVLIDAYPRPLSDESVATLAEMALSGTFDKYLGQLRTLQLVEGPRAALRASEELFT